MTGIVVSNENCYAELAWTGAENSFNPSFRALADADVHVSSRDADGVITALVNPTHFTVSRDGTGNVTVNRISFPAAPKDILIERITPATQTVSFSDLESFPADIHTRLHTAAAMRAAEAKRKLVSMQTAVDLLTAMGADIDEAVAAAAASATAAGDAQTAITALLAQSTIMYFANGVPNNAFGKNGDVYVNIGGSTWPIYGPKSGGLWGSSVGELKPVAGNVSMASNAAGANRLIRSAGADKNQKDSAITVADDGTMSGVRFGTPSNSYDPVPKDYADGLFATNDALLLKGGINCTANPNYPAADAGHVYKVTHAGKIGGGSGVNVEVGDTLFCAVDGTASGNHATVGANWFITQSNVDSPLKSADIGTTVQGYDAATTKNNVEDQAITGGGRVTVKDLGTITTGTLTPDPGDRPMQKYTNNGAHTLAPGTNYGAYMLTVVNGASAGAVTTSGWTKVVGSFTTTNGHKFRCHCSIDGDGSVLIIQAMQ